MFTVTHSMELGFLSKVIEQNKQNATCMSFIESCNLADQLALLIEQNTTNLQTHKKIMHILCAFPAFLMFLNFLYLYLEVQ